MNSPFAWPGGKRALKKHLLSLIPPHELYVEVFCGSAKLLFGKEPSACEIVNDLNGDLANFFRVVKHRPAELAEAFDRELIHAERFRELRSQPDAKCELDRALRFGYLTWYSYGAKGEHFAGGTLNEALNGSKLPRRPLDRVRALLEATATRLRNVLIEQRDYADVLTRYDSPTTWFYLDPPYVHFGGLARYEALTTERREQLFEQLAGLKASWLMSFDDCDEIRKLSRRHRFKVQAVKVTYSLANVEGSRGKRGEVLISH